MSLRAPLLSSFLLLLACSVAWARVGESRARCDARYGAPVRVSDDGSLVTYRYGAQSVAVHFSRGVADMVSHSKLPSVAGESAFPFSDAQIVAILKANGGERSWLPQGSAAGGAWRTSDGSLYAVYYPSLNRILVYTQAFPQSGGGLLVAGGGG